MDDPDAAGRAALGLHLATGELQRLPPNADGPARVDAINRLIDAHNARLSQQIWVDGQNRRMLVGYQENGWGTGKHWGIKISEEGYDVLTAEDAHLLFKLAY